MKITIKPFSYQAEIAADRAEISSLFNHTPDSFGREHAGLLHDQTPDTVMGEILANTIYRR